MIVGSQMEPSELAELPKKTLREEAGRAFRHQAAVSRSELLLSMYLFPACIRILKVWVLQASMDMWLCMRRAINDAERAKKAYEDGMSKVVDAGKVIQEHAELLKDKAALERQLRASEDKLDEMRGALEASVAAVREAEAAKVAVAMALEEAKRSREAEIQSAVREAITRYRSSEEFTAHVDSEVSAEMMDLIYRFKCFNPGTKLNLDFTSDPPPLPEGVTEEMIEAYEGEDARPESNLEAETEAVVEAEPELATNTEGTSA